MDSLRPDCNFDDFPSTVVKDSHGNPCPFMLLQEPFFDLNKTNTFTGNPSKLKTGVMKSSQLNSKLGDLLYISIAVTIEIFWVILCLIYSVMRIFSFQLRIFAVPEKESLRSKQKDSSELITIIIVVKVGPLTGKTVTVRIPEQLNVSVMRKLRKTLKIEHSMFLQFIKANGQIVLSNSRVKQDDILYAMTESRFGSDVIDEISYQPNEYVNGRTERLDKSSLSITFANVSGGLNNRFGSDKRNSIKASTYGDAILLLNECNCVSSDASFLAETYGCDARVSDLSQVTYENGKRAMLNRRKLSGFGTAMIAKYQDLLEFIDISAFMQNIKFEILAGFVNLQGSRGLLITGYRSPSMRQEDEINSFYESIYNIFIHHYGTETAFCILCMDDNKTIPRVKSIQQAWIEHKCGMKNMIGDQITRMASSTQPDSVFCIFKPLSCTIRATVIAPLGMRMDHNAIRIRITGCVIKPRKPIYRTITRQKRVMSDEAIGVELSKSVRAFTAKYADYLDGADVQDQSVDAVATDLYGLINETKRFGWKTEQIKLPDCLEDTADKWTVKIGIEHARMEKLGLHLQNHPRDRVAYSKFVEAQTRCQQFMADKRDADCDRDLKHNKGDNCHGGKNMGNFYRWCDRFVSNRGSYLTKTHSKLTDLEKAEKLAAHDKTFISDNPNFNCRMEEMLDTIPDRQFSLDEWKPSEKNTKLVDFIKSRSKIDKFYRINAEIIAAPLFILLKCIEKSCFFPTTMRTSRATFIPGRTIFSLETLVKIVEGILSIELVACDVEDFKLNGDPGSFAYRKTRGVLSCLGITLGELEMAPRNELIDAVMNVIDLKKAFNTTKRSTVVKEAQRVAGAGKLLMTRWKDRTYTFEGQIRGHNYNRGTDAGATLAVWGFDKWINTDTSCQTRGPKNGNGDSIVLANCNFSDDRNPQARGSDVESGVYQSETLDGMEKWAVGEDAEFHTEGAKAPGTLLFSQVVNGVQTRKPDGVEDLSLCGRKIKITDKQKILGVTIATRVQLYSEKSKSSVFRDPSSQNTLSRQAQKLIDKHGFYLDPDLNYLVNSAYRFHQLKDELSPLKMWTIVNSYFLGKLRFAISFHYLRCTQKQVDFMRFHYGMSMAAIMNVSAYEALGAACCQHRAIKEGNAAFELLRRCLRMPSIKEMAIKDARVCISQMAAAKQDWFFPHSERARKPLLAKMEELHKKGKHYYPKTISNEIKGTFIEDIYNLAGENCDVTEIDEPMTDHDVSCFKRNWFMALEAATNLANLPDRKPMSVVRTARKIFKTKSLVDLGAFETNDRRLKRRTPSKPLIPARICKVYPPDVGGKEYLFTEEPKPYVFSCNHEVPSLWLEKDLKPDDILCLACGDLMTNSELKGKPIQCQDCQRFIHKRCVRKRKLKAASFRCEQITERFVPVKIGSQKLRPFTSITPKVATGQMRCLICGELNLCVTQLKSRCSKPGCNFSCHSECITAQVLVQKALGLDVMTHNRWSCDDVLYWIDKESVEKLCSLREVSSDLVHVMIDNFNIEKVVVHKDARKRRYENSDDDLRCRCCDEIVPLEESDHLWSRCQALASSPVSKDAMESIPRIKKRCLEILNFKKTAVINETMTLLPSETPTSDEDVNNTSSARPAESTSVQVTDVDSSESLIELSYADASRRNLRAKTPRRSPRTPTQITKSRRINSSVRLNNNLNTPVAKRTRSKRKKNSKSSSNIPLDDRQYKKKCKIIDRGIELRNKYSVLDIDDTSEPQVRTNESPPALSIASKRPRKIITRDTLNSEMVNHNMSRPAGIALRGKSRRSIILDSEMTGPDSSHPDEDAPRGKSRKKKCLKLAAPARQQHAVRRSARLAGRGLASPNPQAAHPPPMNQLDRHLATSFSRQSDKLLATNRDSNHVETLEKTRGNNLRLEKPQVAASRRSESADIGVLLVGSTPRRANVDSEGGAGQSRPRLFAGNAMIIPQL